MQENEKQRNRNRGPIHFFSVNLVETHTQYTFKERSILIREKEEEEEIIVIKRKLTTN